MRATNSLIEGRSQVRQLLRVQGGKSFLKGLRKLLELVLVEVDQRHVCGGSQDIENEFGFV
jgi:hypothetical protein